MDEALNRDRGQDFDVDGQYRGQRRGFRGTSENSKTKICLRWKAGHCRFGDQCNFAHGDHELRKLPPRSDMYGGPGPGQGQGRGRGAGGRGYGAYGGGYVDGGMGPGRGGQMYGEPYGRGGGYAAAAAYGAMGGGMDGGRMVNGGDQYLGTRGAPGGAFNQPPPSFGGWTQYFTEDGEAYYHHAASGATQWEKPPDWLG